MGSQLRGYKIRKLSGGSPKYQSYSLRVPAHVAQALDIDRLRFQFEMTDDEIVYRPVVAGEAPKVKKLPGWATKKRSPLS